MNELIEQILKEAKISKHVDLITDLARVMKLRIDEQVVSKGMKFLNVLENLEKHKEVSLIEKQDLASIREKIRNSMSLLQDATDDLFTLHERLVRESEMLSNT
jgi:hypothetical protein